MFELIFFTSSRIKTQHVRYLSRNFDIKIINFKEIRANANYDEPRIYDRQELLKISFENAKKQAEISKLGKNKAFIIEDTSVDICALSRKNSREYPGVDIKYWMEDTKFADIDYELLMEGNNRSTIVRSDFILYLPQVREEPFHFFGTTSGRITEKESELETNPIYPWLDNKTFNKWFIPGNESSVISQLPIEKANIHDFRRKPFENILDLLHNESLLKFKSEIITEPYQRPLESHHFHFVTGLSCSGKTTIANYLVEELDFLHVEASDFMHEIYRENHGIDSNVKIGTFAKELLKINPTAVAERVENYLRLFEPQDVIVTGFRILEEVEYVKSSRFVHLGTKVVVIDATKEKRLLRRVERNRDINTEESLVARDNREMEMGTKKLIKHPDAVTITNNSSFENYYASYRKELEIPNVTMNFKKHSDIDKLQLKQLIILALYVAREQQREKSDYFSTTEICQKINNMGVSKKRYVNNVGRFFSQKTNALFEVKRYEKGRKYRLSNTGAGFAKTILRKFKF